jgi:hypothetical protein
MIIMNKPIHKLRVWEGLFWKSICTGKTGMDKKRVTEDDSKVTCPKCLKLIGQGNG